LGKKAKSNKSARLDSTAEIISEPGLSRPAIKVTTWEAIRRRGALIVLTVGTACRIWSSSYSNTSFLGTSVTMMPAKGR